MGGRQAAAAARASNVLPGNIQPILGTVPRQRGGVFRFARARTACRPRCLSHRQQSRPDRLLSRGARLPRAGHRRALTPCGRPRAGWRHPLLRGSQRTIQSAARRACRRGERRVPLRRRAGGDVHLSQPHRLQRIVPAQQRRRVQRAGRPLCQAAHLRRDESPSRRQGARAARSDARPRAIRSHRRRRPRRRFSVFRSAVRAVEQDGAIHELYRRRLRRRRPPAAAGRGRSHWPDAAAMS